MSDMHPEEWADAALRRALQDIEIPEAAPDFDARVLSAVRGRSPFREALLAFLRPALATASASAVVTLLLVHWSTRPVRTVEATSIPPPSIEGMRVPEPDLTMRLLQSPRPTYLLLMDPNPGGRR